MRKAASSVFCIRRPRGTGVSPVPPAVLSRCLRRTLPDHQADAICRPVKPEIALIVRRQSARILNVRSLHHSFLSCLHLLRRKVAKEKRSDENCLNHTKSQPKPRPNPSAPRRRRSIPQANESARCCCLSAALPCVTSFLWTGQSPSFAFYLSNHTQGPHHLKHQHSNI